MKDSLKKFVDENRKEFDTREPFLSGVSVFRTPRTTVRNVTETGDAARKIKILL